MLSKFKKDLLLLADKKRAQLCLRFFKTGPGQYGEGDRFLGVSGVAQRKIAKQYRDIDLKSLQKLITSPFHEYRQTSFMILVYKYQRAKTKHEKEEIFSFSLTNHTYANNWDIVDISTPHVIGQFLFEFGEKKDFLYQFAHSRNLWERRMSILATFSFIRNNDFTDALKIAKVLLNDKHDLIHKAVGWMLREIGKKNQNIEEKFLQQYYRQMPRTMLRYAIEKFSEKKRKKYLYS